MSKACMIAVFCVGFSGLAAQMTLMRELLIVFSGNELTIGIILANWLILEATGCFFLGRCASRRRGVVTIFAWIAILFSLALPASIYLTRMAKPLLAISVGEEVGVPVIILVSFFALLPVSLLHGASFTSGCRIYAFFLAPVDSSTGRVYIWETVGTLAGGIAWTFLLIPLFHSFQVAAALAMLNALACLLLLIPIWNRHGAAGRLATVAAGLLLAGPGYTLFSSRVEQLHTASVRAQWQGQNVVHYQNSRYGNLCVVESSGQYIFFQDGSPAISTPVPDIGLVEKFVHIPLLAHPNPENILILSGGVGGVLNEVLKHPSVGQVDYAEIDPLIFELMHEFTTPLTEIELADPRVRIRHLDGRLFLRTRPVDYDLILTGLAGPENLQTSRYFTQEFFLLAARKLGQEGILVIRLPGSLVYRNQELRNLNSSIFQTMQSVFPYVRAIPGESANLFLASQSAVIEDFDELIFAQRLVERKLSEHGFMPWHIKQKLNLEWTPWFQDFIADGSRRLNRDFQPLGVFYSVAYWSSLVSPSLRWLFAWLQQMRLVHLLTATAAASILIVLFRRRLRDFGSGVPLCTATTGFAGMIFDLTLLFAFQSVYGYVFSWLGLLVAGFMTGSACGALITNSIKTKNDRNLFMAIELAIAGFAFALPLALLSLQAYLANPSVLQFARWLFLLALLIAGLLTGAQFPLANRLYLRRDGRYDRTAGLLYGLDLLGGWLGGIAGGFVLLPILGLPGSCVVVGLVKLTGFANLKIVASEPRRGGAGLIYNR